MLPSASVLNTLHRPVIPLRVGRLEGDQAILDFEQPRAGKTLTFDVKVLAGE